MFRPGFALLCALFTLTLCGANALAETRYISDEFRVPLRKSPCSRCAILHQGLKSGLKLELLGAQDGWSHVRTPSGLEGWIENQYVVSQPIAKLRISQYRQQAEKLEAENHQLKAQIKSLEEENTRLSSRVGALSEDNQATAGELNRIKQVSADTLNIHEQNQSLLKDNEVLQNKIDVLMAINQRLESSQTQKWFMYGAFAVFLGAILSVVLPRLKRKRRGYSEWA